MAATSYTALPSSAYVGLGSQGDLLHSAHYGTYDSGIGSITAHPYKYQTTNFDTHLPDHQQHSLYSDDYLRSTHSNGGYLTHQPEHYSTDRYAEQSTYNQDPLSNNYTTSQTERHNDRSTLPNSMNENYAATTTTTQPPYKTTMDNHHVESNHPHQTSHSGTTQHHPPATTDNQHYQSQSNHSRSEHDLSSHPPPKQQQQQRHLSQPLPQSNVGRTEHDTSNHPPPKQQQQQRHQSQPSSQPNQVRSEHQTSNKPPKQPPPVRHHSPSNGYASETTVKTTNPPAETKTTKSSKMRAAANKQKEETREQKHKDGNFPSTKKKSTPPKPTKSHQQPKQHSPSDDEQSDKGKTKRNKKQSHSVPKQHKSHREDYQTEDNNSSNDDDDHDPHTRSKSKKRAAFPDRHHENYRSLPPLRRGRGPPYYDPANDYPFPPGHPLRGRYPHHDDYPMYPYSGRYDYRHRHLYEDAYDVPPYLAPYHDPYDGFFDYEKRKAKPKLKKPKDKNEAVTDHEGITGNETEHEDESKSQRSKKTKNQKNPHNDDDTEHARQHWSPNYHEPPYYDGGDMLEVWRQERNDYLKKKFKPSIHDVLYSQQWMKSDSYVENQRRRALRDSQGYYFPYKKYTLKDYKDLQKSEAQHNPYASINETSPDRKERAKKRQEYASHFERQPGDQSGGQQKTPRDMPPKKPWHASNGEPAHSEKLSKRERALEYAKVQVVKHRPLKAPKNRSGGTDPTEQYVNNLFPQENDDGEGSENGRNSRNNQSGDDDD